MISFFPVVGPNNVRLVSVVSAGASWLVLFS